MRRTAALLLLAALVLVLAGCKTRRRPEIVLDAGFDPVTIEEAAPPPSR